MSQALPNPTYYPTLYQRRLDEQRQAVTLAALAKLRAALDRRRSP